MNLKPYPEYRDSGIEWLGQVPDHWEAKQFRRALARNDGGVWGGETDDNGTNGTIVLRSTEQTVDGNWRIEEPAVRALCAHDRANALLLAGDLVVTKSSGSELHIGKTTVVTEEIEALGCCFSNFMQRLRVNIACVPRFVYYVLNSPIGREQMVFGSSTTTGLANLTGDIIGNIWVAFPSIGEQRAIAAFLDRETKRIDALIAKKQRQIELLQEKRSALISHAVTKGLDPNAKMKDPGVEWLGEIPDHWEIKRLKSVATFQRGHDLTASGRNDGPFPVVSSAGVIGYHDEYRAVGPGLVTGRYGTIGDFHYVEGNFWPMNTTLYCVNNWGNHVRFLWYMLQNVAALFLLNSSKSAVPGVDRNDLHPIEVAVPDSIQEQMDIARFLDSQTANLDTLSGKIRDSIDRLREYRSALISAAVTGKIDVRQEVACAGPAH